MADKLDVSITQTPSFYEVRAVLSEREKLPEKIFMYENSGTSTLGDYVAVCTPGDLSSRQEWTGSPIPTFGNRYVRAREAYVRTPDSDTAAEVAANILASVRRLKATYTEPPTQTTSYDL